MKEGYWVVRTYSAGTVGEKTKFWVQGARPSARNRRKEKSEIHKQEQNEASAVKAAARVLNLNFRAGDLLLGLDYSGEGLQKLLEALPAGLEEEERQDRLRELAARELRNCLDRVKRAMDKEGAELRYHLGITSDMDGDTGELVRVHHHIIVNREAKEAFRKKWMLGGVDWSPLSEQADYTPIAEYLLKQVRRIKDKKKYTSSRNLVRPQPKDRIAVSDAELRPPKGALLMVRSEYRPGRPQYIRYILPEGQRTRTHKAADAGGRE